MNKIPPSRLAVCALLSQTACLNVALAPHLNRERELAPAAASDRFTTVLDKAAAFERQNESSRDVYWYRLWRAGAMIEMGQAPEGLQLIDQILREVAVAAKTPAQPDRFRMFAHDLQARGFLALNRPADALAHLERSYGLAGDVALETGGDCDRELMLGARAQQLANVARMAQDPGRADSAGSEQERHLRRWQRCLTSRDFPGMRSVAALTAALTTPNGAQAPVPPPPTAVPPPPLARTAPPPPRAAPPPPPPPPAAIPPPPRAAAGSLAAVPATRERYNPIDATPYQAGIDAAMPLIQKQAPKVSASMSISTDGRNRALHLRVMKRRYRSAVDLAPLFESTVVFFEQTRGVSPGVGRVVVETKDHVIVATKSDVFDLFVDKIDPQIFAARLRRVR